MLKAVLFLLLLKAAHSCRSGFDLVNGECRGNYTKLDTYFDEAIADAVAKCGEIAGNPIIIHNEEQQQYWTAHVTGGSSNVWTLMGLQCNASLLWQWVDGSEMDYKSPLHDENYDSSCADVGRFAVLRADGYWSSYGPSHGHNPWTTDLFCTVPNPHPTPSIDNCAAFADDVDDCVCYQVGSTAETWQEAQLICRKLGANLASIHNARENTFVRRLGLSNGAVNGLYLGATIESKGRDYGWIDGSAWDYQNFAPGTFLMNGPILIKMNIVGFPRDDFGDCIAMDTTTTAGGWMNIECTKPLPVACVREKGTYVEPTCSTRTWTEEGKLITSPGFPYIATMPCDFFLEVSQGKNVEVEILLLEANTCCDSLVIYDGYLGGTVLATLTGAASNVTFTTTDSNIMRVSWLPTSGANVLGVAMAFKGV